MKLIILQGPPCSGKSTWVNEFIQSLDNNEASNWIVVNRDTLRYTLGGGKYTMDHEKEVTEIINDNMEDAVKNKLNIISDNTNLNPKYNQQLEDWAKEHGYEVEYKTFYVPFKEAMKRSKARKATGGLYIPRDVMKGFYIKYFEDEFRKEMTDPKIKEADDEYNKYLDKNLNSAIIVDLDGTIALHDGREPFEWDKLDTDVCDYRLAAIIKATQSLCFEPKIIFLTGRPEKVRESTKKWLDKYFLGINYELMMREDNDFSHGDDFKRKMYLEKIKPYYHVLGAFEDSQKCIDMYRKEGVLCLAVSNNDY